MKRVLLFIKDTHSAKETANYIRDFLVRWGNSVELFVNLKDKKPNLENTDLIVVVGGDGTFLSAARNAFDKNIPLVGINEGRFGFLTEVEKERAPEVIEKILKGLVSPQKRMMISAYLLRDNEKIYIGTCLNDVVVSKGSIARMVEVSLYIHDELVVKVYGDGVIVATPTGSTAYALSSGGPIVYPLSEDILFVPICPHTLSNRPLVLPHNMELLLENHSQEGMAYLTLDGQEVFALKKGDKILIKKSQYYCYMYPDPNKSFFSILKEKLKWG